MRLPRYLAVAGHRDPFGLKRALRRKLTEAGLECAFSVPGLEVYSEGPSPLLLAGGAGILLGPVFRRTGSMEALAVLEIAEAERIATSKGQYLIENCWGDYVAFLADGTATTVLRPPFCDLGCFTAEFRGLQLLASDLSLLELCGVDTSDPDWTQLAAHLHTAGLRQQGTCVAGIDELLWGSRMTIGAGTCRVEASWTPWAFAGAQTDHSREELARSLRELTITCIGAQLRSIDHANVLLSGGLDSSILAACVAATGTRLTCLNLPFGDSAGDERSYARSVAAHLDAPLFEVEPDVADVDIARSSAVGLARPTSRAFLQSTRLAKQRTAVASGGQALLDGGGGDNLFCSLQSAAPVADRLLREGIGGGVLETAADLARMTEASIPLILARSISRAFLRSPAYRWRTDNRFLTREAIERAGKPRHRWLDAPPGALPGAASHIALMIVVEGLLETSNIDVPEWAPLMAQPLVEFCLSVPSWNWLDRGHNRAVARRAFENDLPGEIAWRRTKGSPDGFVAKLFAANRSKLTNMLLNGTLAAEGLIDRDAVSAALASPHPVKGHDYIRLLKLADVEAWARARKQAAHASPAAIAPGLGAP